MEWKSQGNLCYQCDLMIMSPKKFFWWPKNWRVGLGLGTGKTNTCCIMTIIFVLKLLNSSFFLCCWLLCLIRKTRKYKRYTLKAWVQIFLSSVPLLALVVYLLKISTWGYIQRKGKSCYMRIIFRRHEPKSLWSMHEPKYLRILYHHWLLGYELTSQNIYRLNWFIWKLLVLDMNTWTHLTVQN